MLIGRARRAGLARGVAIAGPATRPSCHMTVGRLASVEQTPCCGYLCPFQPVLVRNYTNVFSAVIIRRHRYAWLAAIVVQRNLGLYVSVGHTLQKRQKLFSGGWQRGLMQQLNY